MIRQPTMILGTVLDGDLDAMFVPGPRGRLGRRHWFGLTWDQLTQHVILIGATGTGKTVTLLRLAQAAMHLPGGNPGEPPPRVLYLDAKGLPDRSRDIFLSIATASGATRVASWPEDPINGFVGSAEDLRERISGLWDPQESPFHHAEAVSLLDLVVHTPPAPTTLDELIRRTRPGMTAAINDSIGTPDAIDRKAEALGYTSTQWNSLHLRLKALHATVGSQLDAPAPTLLDVDAAWASIPGTRAPQAAADITTWLLHLVADLATCGEPRPTLVILDEFSAIGTDGRASAAAAGLIERTRSAGVAIVLSSQTTDALGRHRDRLLRTAGSLITHRTPAPEEIAALAGTETVWEDTHQVDSLGVRRQTSGRRQEAFRVAPNLIRHLPVGSAVAISQGRWTLVAVARTAGSSPQ